MIQLNEIHKMDCLEGMKQIEDASVDLILCDLPYGMLKTKHTEWDVRLPFDELWEQYQRIAKVNAAIVLTCTHPFTNAVVNSLPKGYKYQELIWYKSSGSGFLNAKKMHVKQHENIIVAYKKPPIYNPQKYPINERFRAKGKAKKSHNKLSSKAFTISGKASENYQYRDDGTRYPDTILEFDSVLPIKSVSRKGMHPTEKPVDLFAYLIKTFTNEGAVVLDNCMGSGTTALACLATERNFIGFELEERYWNLSQERLDEFKRLN